ncbi:MAG: efflux RND transporter periplasmic adaptor subunit [Pseudomonadota bacterium]
MPTPDRPSVRFRLRSALMRGVRLVLTLSVTAFVIGGAGIAVWQGSALLADRAAAAEPPVAAPPLPVEIVPLRLEAGFAVERQFLGEVSARQSADLSFELGGQITEVLVDEGQAVAVGDVLARVDTALLETDERRIRAARAALEADLDAAERRFARQVELKARGFSPEEALEQARASVDSLTARIAETDAALQAVTVRIEKAVLRAPYAGRIAARMVDTGATVAGGTPIFRLLETGPAEVRVGLPSWVEAAAGTRWTVSIDGTDHTGTLTALRPDIDPETRTRTALLQIEETTAPFGAIAVVAVPQTIEAQGAWVPRAALREGAPGVWTVLALDAEDRVRPAVVEILHAEADRLYVRGGLSDGLPLITGGPHRIVPGQRVRPLGAS